MSISFYWAFQSVTNIIRCQELLETGTLEEILLRLTLFSQTHLVWFKKKTKQSTQEGLDHLKPVFWYVLPPCLAGNTRGILLTRSYFSSKVQSTRSDLHASAGRLSRTLGAGVEKGLKSIMISLSGSLNNARLYNRTHSLMAETDKNNFTHWQQTACLFIQHLQ